MPTKLYVVQSEMRPAGAHFVCRLHGILFRNDCFAGRNVDWD